MIEPLVDALRCSDFAFSLVIAGGGTEAIGELYRRGGGAGHFLQVHIPYSNESLADYLGYNPMQAVSCTTAKSMARKAYEEMIRIHKPTDPHFHVGIACTSSLKTHREREGREHQCYLSFYTKDESGCMWINPVEHFVPLGKSREEQEHEVAERLLVFMVQASNNLA